MSNPTIRPLDDRIVIDPVEAEEKTSGGIILPDTAKQRPQRGIVIAVGPGRTNEKGERLPVCVKVGDEVLYGKYSGSEVKLGDKEYKIMRESDLLAKITH